MILFKFAIAAVVIMGMTYAALAADSADGRATPDTRFSSDKPEVKILFQHTVEKPYDIKCLSWYGGVMDRIVVENKSANTIVVHFEITGLKNGVVVVPANHAKIAKACEVGASVTLMDVLSNDPDAALAYGFKLDGLAYAPTTASLVTTGPKLSFSNSHSILKHSLAAF